MAHFGKMIVAHRAALARARHKAGEAGRSIMRIGVVAVSSGAMGFWAGSRAKKAATDPTITQGPNFFGVPAELALGLLAEGAAFWGVGGGEEHWRAAADGLLANYFSQMGYEYGKGRGPTDSAWKPRAVLGEYNSRGHYDRKVSGAALTPAELTKLALANQ